MKRHGLADRHLLVVDDLAELFRGFDCGDVVSLSVFSTADRDEIQLRTAGALLTILQLHRVDDQGRCRRCRPTRRGRLRWLRVPRTKAPCQILKVAYFFSTAPLDEIWLRLLPRIGIHRSLSDIRANLADWTSASELDATAAAVPTEPELHGRHALRTNNFAV